MAPVDNHVTRNDDEIDLGDLFSVLVRGWRLIALIFVVVVLLGAAYAFFGPATYEWRALIRVNESNPIVQRLSWAQDSSLQEKLAEERLEQFESNRVLIDALRTTQGNTHVRVLNQIPLLGALMARHHEQNHEGLAQPFLGLDGWAWGGEQVVFKEFSLPLLASEQFFILERTADGYSLTDDQGEVLLESGVFGQPMDFQFEGRKGRITVDEIIGRPGTRFEITQEPLFDTLAAIKGDLDIEPLDLSANVQLYVVTYRSSDGLVGPKFIAALVDSFVSQQSQELRSITTAGLSLLKSRESSLRNSVQVAEQNLQQFKAQYPEVSLSASLKNLLEDLLTIEAERAELKLQRDLLTAHYDSEHVLIEELDKHLSKLRQSRDALDDLIGDYIGQEGELLRLERDAQLTQHLYTTVQAELAELQATIDEEAQDVVQTEFNVGKPEVVAPKRALVLAVSVLLGLMLGVFVVLMRAFLRPKVYTPAALQDLSKFATLAIPNNQPRRRWCACLSLGSGRCSRRRAAVHGLLVDAQPGSPALESLRALRAAFDDLPKASELGLKLAFVGPTMGVGKTFVAVNIAALLALEGKRVLVVDADMRRPRLHEYLGYDMNHLGLAQLLEGQGSLQQALTEVRPNLTVLPAGQRPVNPTELLLQPAFDELLQSLSAQFDYVIVTTPPILPVADSLAVLRQIDAAYLVVRADQSTYSEVNDALERLQTAGVKQRLSGAVLNGVTPDVLSRTPEQYYSYG